MDLTGSRKGLYEASDARGGDVALELERGALGTSDPEIPLDQAPARGVDEHGRLSIALKRTIDVVISLALLLLLSPLWLFIAALIKLDSPGPILFRQMRVGRGREPFAMLKFRTMIKDADVQKLQLMHLNEADGLFKISSDPRVTRVGRALRSTSLDELPQLLHVLTGKMSLVGPRPLVADEDAAIPSAYQLRSEMRPGMTGAWQVAGASRIPLREMVVLDCRYVHEWSLLSDLRILVMTFPHVVLRRGI